jgi:hypothetical protein
VGPAARSERSRARPPSGRRRRTTPTAACSDSTATVALARSAQRGASVPVPAVPLSGAKREVEGCARDSAGRQHEQDHRADGRIALARRRQQCPDHLVLLAVGSTPRVSPATLAITPACRPHPRGVNGRPSWTAQ